MNEDTIRHEEKGITTPGPPPDEIPEQRGSATTEVAVAEPPEPESEVEGPGPSEVATVFVNEGLQEPSSEESAVPTVAAETAEEVIEPAISLEKFQQLQAEKEELFDRLLRKQAEFENFRKRTEKEKQEFYDFALFNFIKELLPVLDGLERGLYAPEGETVESYKKGIELILKQLRDVLAAAGLQPLRSMGQFFDPNYHQAVLREENNNLAENEIIEELQRGYAYKDRLLRPSMVKVAVPVASDTPVQEPKVSETPVQKSEKEGS